jgi:PST family polysaccharide transporter
MLRVKIAKGAAWMVLFRALDRSLGVVSTLILARLLVPADFGLVAMAMSVIALIEMTGAFSFEVPLIQKQDPTRDHYDTAWTLKVLFDTGAGVATAALAYPAAIFYNEPRLMEMMLVLSIAWALRGFENIGLVEFRRSMDFARETRFLLARRLAGFAVTIACALTLKSYWALVYGILAGRVAGVALSYAMSPYRPRFTLRARADLFSVSGWLFINNLLYYASQRVPHFFLGRVHGPVTLGLYTVGSELAYLPQSELVAPINRAVFPGYARMIHDLVEMRRGFLGINGLIAAIAIPAGIGIAVLAEPMVAALLGPRWAGAVVFVQILALAGALSALTSNAYSAYLALGRPSVATAILLIEVIVMLPAMFILGRAHGAVGVAYAELIANVVGIACSYPVLFRTLKISARAYIANSWRPLIAAVFMGAGVNLLVGFLDTLGAFAVLAAAVPAGMLLYAAVLFPLWILSGRPQGAERIFMTQLQLQWARVASRKRGEALP